MCTHQWRAVSGYDSADGELRSELTLELHVFSCVGKTCRDAVSFSLSQSGVVARGTSLHARGGAVWRSGCLLSIHGGLDCMKVPCIERRAVY